MKSTLYILIILLSFTYTKVIALTDIPLTEEEIVADLLEKLSEAKEDTNKVILLQKLANELRNNDSDKGIEYGLKGVELAKKIGWKKGEAISYNSLSMCFAAGSINLTKALKYDFKTLRVYRELKDTLNMGHTFARIGSINDFLNKDSNMSKMDIPNNYLIKAEVLYKAIKAYKELSRLYKYQFDIYNEKNDHKKALEFHEKYSYALETYLKQKHKEEIDTLSLRMYEDIVLEKEQIREGE